MLPVPPPLVRLPWRARAALMGLALSLAGAASGLRLLARRVPPAVRAAVLHAAAAEARGEAPRSSAVVPLMRLMHDYAALFEQYGAAQGLARPPPAWVLESFLHSTRV